MSWLPNKYIDIRLQFSVEFTQLKTDGQLPQHLHSSYLLFLAASIAKPRVSYKLTFHTKKPKSFKDKRIFNKYCLFKTKSDAHAGNNIYFFNLIQDLSSRIR